MVVKEVIMKLCCGTNLYASHPLETALREISARGIEAVDLWASPTLCDHVNPDRDDPEYVRDLLEKYNLRAVSLTAFLITKEERIRRMEFAASLGIPVVIWEPAHSVDWKANMLNLKEGSIPFGDEGGGMNEYFGLISEYLDIAKSLGIKIGIEVPHRYTLNEYLYQIWRMRQAVQDPSLCYIIAPPHADARGFSAMNVLDMTGTGASYMLYLWDVKKDFSFPSSDGAFGSGEEQMPGGGGRDFSAMISYFREKGFDGWYNISCHGVEGWTDIGKMGKCLDKAVSVARKALA